MAGHVRVTRGEGGEEGVGAGAGMSETKTQGSSPAHEHWARATRGRCIEPMSNPPGVQPLSAVVLAMEKLRPQCSWPCSGAPRGRVD